MSKTLDALNGVHQIRKDHHAFSISSPHAAIGKYIQERAEEKFQVEEEKRRYQSPFPFQAIVMAAGIAAVFLSFFLLNLNRQYGTQTSLMKSTIVSQERKIQLLEDNVKDMKQMIITQHEDSKDMLQDFQEKLKKSEMKLTQIMETSAKQASVIDDLNWKIQSLTDKYIELNARLRDLKAQ